MSTRITKPRRPALRYYGSKWRMANWIWSYLPPHEHRVVLFAGSLSDTLRWPVPPLETAVDLDHRVFNFFRVLRERPQELVNQIRLTPWHQSEYDASHDISDDPLEDARRLWISCWMSIQGGPMPTKSSFRFMKSSAGRYSVATSDGMDTAHLLDVAERLKQIQFLNKDAVNVARSFADEPNVLLYADPPYVRQTTPRTGSSNYRHDTSDDLHVTLADVLHSARGMAVVCGYQSDLYNRLYAGWERVDKQVLANSGSTRVESLWLSPNTSLRLRGDLSSLPLFGATAVARM